MKQSALHQQLVRQLLDIFCDIGVKKRDFANNSVVVNQ